jgi:[ribosomal protein S5]-alanine N-acetyltransferase
MMAHLQLSPLQGSEDADWFAAMLAPGYFGKEDVPRQILEQTRSFLAVSPRPDPWWSYLAWDADTAVGVCAYKLPPGSAGAVEIAYGTFPAYEARGYVKGMISALFALAVRSGASIVFAHTLAENNASNGALRSEGFNFVGEVTDPEDGLVWRWEKRA